MFKPRGIGSILFVSILLAVCMLSIANAQEEANKQKPLQMYYEETTVDQPASDHPGFASKLEISEYVIPDEPLQMYETFTPIEKEKTDTPGFASYLTVEEKIIPQGSIKIQEKGSFDSKYADPTAIKTYHGEYFVKPEGASDYIQLFPSEDNVISEDDIAINYYFPEDADVTPEVREVYGNDWVVEEMMKDMKEEGNNDNPGFFEDSPFLKDAEDGPGIVTRDGPGFDIKEDTPFIKQLRDK